MARLMDDLGAYLKEVIGEGKERVLLLFDLLGIILFFFPQLAEYVFRNEWLARRIGAVIFVLSFSWANFILYRKLKGRIDEYEDTRANIRFTKEKDFCCRASHHSRYFSHEGKSIHQSEILYRNGLPIGVITGAELKGWNWSEECGHLVWKITEVDLPPLFNLPKSGEGSFQWELRGDVSFDRIKGFHYAFEARYKLPIEIAEQDPRSFAQGLSSVSSYRIVIQYHTKRVDNTESKPHYLTLKGDFQEFRDEICKQWKNWFKELAQLAECQ
jgi:hypothetical protein